MGADPPSIGPPRILHDADELIEVVARLGRELGTRHGDGTVFVAVLRGAVPFLADLVRAVPFAVEVDFLSLSPFRPGGTRARLAHDLTIDLAGRDVVLVEDVVDTGLSLAWLLGELGRREPAGLEVCALVDKPTRRIAPVDLAAVGVVTDASYVIGYGLDHAGRYRNLPLLAEADLAVLREDPDAYVRWLYAVPGDRPDR